MNKSVYFYISTLIISIVMIILISLPQKSSAVTLKPATAPEPKPTVEGYLPYRKVDNMCAACDPLSQDCCSVPQSKGKYPIDLPGPEEPRAPGTNTCFNLLKYNLQ